MSIKIGIAGITGRIGSRIAALIDSDPATFMLAAGLSRRAGPDASALITDDGNILFQKSDVVIDFSTKELTKINITLAVNNKKPIVIGTTGLSEGDYAAAKDAAKTIPILVTANTSIGVTILNHLVKKTAQLTDNKYDIEIFESHHRHKADAPSGTALALAKSAAQGRGITLDDAIRGRDGMTGPRPAGPIGFSVTRGGDVAGDHTVMFLGSGERLELTHRASTPDIFAQGALRAAQWLVRQPPGLYGMDDALGLTDLR